MRHDAPPARPRCGHGQRGHRLARVGAAPGRSRSLSPTLMLPIGVAAGRNREPKATVVPTF